ncbi:hypothetical protein QFC21_003712 [Naganishia friedmannii]|uniref:Uncharacterized protein n=1 Tax=Naganishia friedmannii TaxID=89922 RepID=A0ACC2VQ65_9TREE|nr:hypothetical protein QFC21_003712 [Naganishia friedmannii]
MERTWSNDSGAASSASSGAEETTSLATTIPRSTSRLINQPVVDSPLDSAHPVSSSTARRRYSWNVDEEEQITPKGTRQMIPALEVIMSIQTRHAEPGSSSSVAAKANIEAGLFSDVVLSPIEVKHFAQFRGANPFPAPDGAPRNTQHSFSSDSNRAGEHLGASRASVSDSQQTDSEGEYHELDRLPLQSRHHNETHLPTFESTSSTTGKRKSQSSSRRVRYPSLKITGLDMRDDGAAPSRRRSLQDRAGDLVKQMSKRVVNINADGDDEESMPFNTIEEGDVQSESDSDSLGYGEDTSELAYLDSDMNGKAAEPVQDSTPSQHATPESQIPQAALNGFTAVVVQEPSRNDHSSSQLPKNEGRTLGLFGPNSPYLNR